ncbi:hypothetical protein [uncultured Amnibacterium sp.]|uniref:hypothetical protein n=1 Tax=uncultured Amnibacterium sp. TaxID=1631851 RepID=UPI0035CB69A9
MSGVGGPRRSEEDSAPIRTPAVVALAVLLLAEGVALVVITVVLIVETFTAPSTSITSAIALAVCAGIAAAAILAAGRATLHAAKWVRAFAFTAVIVQAFVGLYAFQGPQPRPDVGAALVVPALAILILLFTPSVIEATRRN